MQLATSEFFRVDIWWENIGQYGEGVKRSGNKGPEIITNP